MELIASVIVALITGVCSVAAALIAAKKTTDTVLQQLELKQAVQNERVDNYQRVTNEKIDRLTEQVNAQAVYGTRIAVLESWREQVERRGTA